MGKHIIFASAVVLAGVVGAEVMAACDTGARVQNLAGATAPLLKGNTACASNGSGGWDGQEFHSGTSGQANNLIDWKHGADASDPTAPVGSWTVADDGTANATVTYTYSGESGSTSYTYSVWEMGGGNYDFCTAPTTLTTTVTIKPGQGACP